MNKQELFQAILKRCQEEFTPEVFEAIRTKKGNTQQAERIYITIIRNILEEMKLSFTEAGSQQPYDFRIEMEDGEKLLLEAKKADTFSIYFNDTCPCKDGYYIVIFTGKRTKCVHTQVDACVVGVNGQEFVKECPWVEDYAAELNQLKEKYRHMPGNMSVYPRPTFKSDIAFILEHEGKKLTNQRIDELKTEDQRVRDESKAEEKKEKKAKKEQEKVEKKKLVEERKEKNKLK